MADQFRFIVDLIFRFMKNFLLLLATLFAFQGVFATRILVSSPDAINEKTYNAGDTIVVQNGVYTNKTITFISNGTAAKPIVLMAQTPGNVILNGVSRLRMSGSYLEVSGFRFLDGNSAGSNGVVEFRSSSSALANNCRLTNTSIENYNPTDNTVDYKWVSIYGTNNKVDNCYFVNKTHSGTMLVVWLVAGAKTSVNHQILNNYFAYRNPNFDDDGKEINGQEIIRIGDSNTSLQPSNCLVEENYFERCNGEMEIISNKSCGNVYRNNMFYECAGALTLRHGNGCTVDGNWFIGNNIANTGGIRIIGEDHLVINNYFQQTRGTNYRAPICVIRGEVNNELNGYAQVKNAKILFNTIYNCRSGFSVSYGSDGQTLSAINSVIAHNVCYQTSSSDYTVQVVQASPAISWENNIFNGGRSTNTPSSGIITNVNPALTSFSTDGYSIYRPTTNSPLTTYRTSSVYAGVSTDIWGFSRPTAKLPGAMETDAGQNRIIPSAATTGVLWMKTPTDEKKKPVNNSLQIFPNPASTEISISLDENFDYSQLLIFDTAGKLHCENIVETRHATSLQINISHLPQGLYVVQLLNNKQPQQAVFLKK